MLQFIMIIRNCMTESLDGFMDLSIVVQISYISNKLLLLKSSDNGCFDHNSFDVEILSWSFFIQRGHKNWYGNFIYHYDMLAKVQLPFDRLLFGTISTTE